MVAIAAMAGLSLGSVVVSSWAAALVYSGGSPLILIAVAIAGCGVVVVVGYIIHRYS